MNKEQLEALSAKTAQDLREKIGAGATVIIMVANTKPDGNYDYFASANGGALRVMGLLEIGASTIKSVLGPRNITSIETKGEGCGSEPATKPD